MEVFDKAQSNSLLVHSGFTQHNKLMRHNKLVRDNIPAIIRRDGKTLVTRTLDAEEYARALRRKLHEEVAEFDAARSRSASVEELADILEVVYALAANAGASVEQLDALRQYKREEHGGFEKRILLLETAP